MLADACRCCWHMMLLWSCTTVTNSCRVRVPGSPQSDLAKGQVFSCGGRTRSVTAHVQITQGRPEDALSPWRTALLPDVTATRAANPVGALTRLHILHSRPLGMCHPNPGDESPSHVQNENSGICPFLVLTPPFEHQLFLLKSLRGPQMLILKPPQKHGLEKPKTHPHLALGRCSSGCWRAL